MSWQPIDVQRVYENSFSRMDKEWQEIIELYDYAIGKHWNAEEIERLKKWGRVPRVYDITAPQLISYDGYLVESEKQPKCRPQGEGDAEMADIQTKVLQKIMKAARYAAARRRAATDAWIARYGYVSIWFDQNSERYSDGEVRATRLHPLSIIPDLDCNSADPDDGTYKIVREWRTVDSILALL